MSIQLRLNVAIALVVALAVVAIVATTVLKASPRINAENQSIMRLSKEFVETAVDSLKGMRDPAVGLENLIEGLRDLRHVEIALVRDGSGLPDVAGAYAPAEGPGVPRWFLRWVSPPRIVERLPVDVDGQNYGQLVISTKSSDEIKEIWDSTIELVIYGTALGLLTIVLASFIIGEAVSPIIRLGGALSKLEAGNYEVRVVKAGPPEIADIGMKFNALAEALGRERERNRRLTERIIGIQDAERRELAHELHDELGPHLFAIRAGATALKLESAKPAPDCGRLAKSSAALLEQIEVIQRSNRRVLERLRPMALAEFGLAAAVEHLAADWRKERPEVQVVCNVGDVGELNEAVELAAYRVVQEGLTNAFRHAGAARIEIGISRDKIAQEIGPEERAGRGPVVVAVRDDGAGMAKESRPGFGLMGMRERVGAVGGSIDLRQRPGGGVEIVAVIPCGRR